MTNLNLISQPQRPNFAGFILLSLLIVFVRVTAVPTVAFAEPAHPRSSSPSDPSDLPSDANPAAEVHSAEHHGLDLLAIGFEEDSFFDRGQPPAGIADYSLISGHLKSHSENHFINGTLELRGSFATSIENYSYIEVPEAYLNLSEPSVDFRREGVSGFELTVGRRRQMWSRLDLDWQLGIWEPLNRFDYLNPSVQGLSGVFAEAKTSNFEMLGFMSLIYLPEQGASYQLQNGSFTSRSPWFNPPPNSIVLFPDRPVSRISFGIETPSVGSVINKFSIGFLIRGGSLSALTADYPNRASGLFYQAAVIRKPRNQLSLPFEAIFRLLPSDSYGEVRIFPQVQYHRLASLEFGYHGPSFDTGVSGLYDEPESSSIPTNELGEKDQMTYQILKPETLISPYVEGRVFSKYSWSPLVKLSTLHTIHGETKTLGLLSDAGSVFGTRTIYKRAVSLSAQATVYSSQNLRVEQIVRWIEETAENGTVLTTNTKFLYGDTWSFQLALELLGSRLPQDQPQTFIGRFRDNGNVSGLITYLF